MHLAARGRRNPAADCRLALSLAARLLARHMGAELVSGLRSGFDGSLPVDSYELLLADEIERVMREQPSSHPSPQPE